MITGIWQSPSGRCFAVVRLGPGQSGGTVLANRDVGAGDATTRWTATVLTGTGALFGIWGLRDDCVYAWGAHGRRGTLVRFDGTEWHLVPGPGFIVSCLHGTAPDNLVA